MTRNDLKPLIIAALKGEGGSAHLSRVAELLWNQNRAEIESSKLVYTWQYDMRWVAERMRKEGTLKPVDQCIRGQWVLESKRA